MRIRHQSAAQRDVAFRLADTRPHRSAAPAISAIMLTIAAVVTLGSLAARPDTTGAQLITQACFGATLLAIAIVITVGTALHRREDMRQRRAQAVLDHHRFEADFQKHIAPLLTPDAA